ncbi:Threonine/homoserine efflux transporter RhtA [Halopseudomonas sabulinigri]|uniref:Threonine/homoserine efflux transporter RhtA n=1 Tax=Halopseudomonas sabulinigri TaxID=472181 RepID=A0A1H1LV41_9GAMM|nr:DMT family transporter [Halopseudomonas sabulinigri]SDR78391.1 Threonine/homoserine efflux transporter RhtA [Halopseudomonas sabulinigri]
MNAVLYVTTVLIWGTTWIAISMQSGSVSVLVSVFYRFALAAGLLLVVLMLFGRLRRLSRRDHGFCVLQGMCVFGFNFCCFYAANAYINSGLESVLFSLATVFNALNGVLFFRQRLTRRLLVANLLGFVGILSLFWHDLTGSSMSADVLLGIGLSLLGTYGFSLGNMISVRHQARGLDLLSTNAYAMGYGALVMLTLAWLTGASFGILWTPAYIGSLLYLALFGSVIGFAAYFALIGRIGAGPAAYATVMFPLIALGMSTLFEGYQWTGSAVLGLVLILLGNAVMFYRPRRPVKQAQAV